jgi:hypothetical protein
LTALWNQDWPYNYYAPAAPGGPGGRAYAGCVATAMSMIMHYWRWPWQGTGTLTYNPTSPQFCPGVTFPELTGDFENAYYDYNGMYGSTEKAASNYLYEPIALLQYHTAISVKMKYCGDGSGAQSTDVPGAMRNYFKYDPTIQQKQKGSTSTAAWGDMMKEQLDLKQPVYASGCGDGCHAFVCDGYDTDNMFHYNLGWDGHGNGYYVADKPNEFVTSTAAVINFKPDRSKGYPIDCNGKNWTVPYMKGMFTDGSDPTVNYAKGVTTTWLFDPSLAGDIIEKITISCEKINLAAGDYLTIYDGENDSAPELGKFSGSTPFTAVTGGSKVFMKFVSAAGSPTADGFLIAYEAKSKQYCDPNAPVTFTAAEGIITDGSPEDMNYPNSASCKWYIKPKGAVEDAEITLKFERLDTEKNQDVIKIYDYYHGGMTPVATISGDEVPEPITIQTKEVMINFASNSYVNGKGLEIKYRTDPVSIKEVENINDLAIYPNPASDKLNVNFNTSTPDNFEITIYNVTGQVVYKETLNNFIGNYHNELNIADFAQGVYLMNIKSSKGAATRKVVVQ